MARFKPNVLVADDSKTIQSFFAEVAASSPIPFNLIPAENGRACVELLNQGHINVAFIDVGMPELNGMDAVGEVRRAGNKTFVALMSATANKVRLQLARQIKVYEFLAKPFTHEDVLAVIRTYCRVTVPSQALIVDDSATVRRIIRRVFEESIFTIEPTEAADGETALAYCENGHYDVVFLDCNMPGLNGLETLDRLRARDPDVKVIMITGDRNEELKRVALAHGATGFLYKPFYPTEIDRELHAIFGLRMPGLSSVQPLAHGRGEAAKHAAGERHWSDVA